MGLDIHSYSKVKFIEGSDSDEIECIWEWTEEQGVEYFTVPYLNPHFPKHSEGLLEGVYTFEECEDGGTFGYSGWSRFRNELARLAGYTPVTKEEILDEWNEYTKTSFMRNPYQSRVFNVTEGKLFELINFSDCEGVINTETCKKIYEDLLTIEHDFTEQYEINNFNSLVSAFKLAAEEEGFVTFG